MVGGVKVEEGELIVSPFEAPFKFALVTHGRWREGDGGRGGKVIISLLKVEEVESMVSPFEAPFEFALVTQGKRREGDGGRGGGKVIISLLASSV